MNGLQQALNKDVVFPSLTVGEFIIDLIITAVLVVIIGRIYDSILERIRRRKRK